MQSQSMRTAILAALPRLRAYAVSLAGSRDRADDLVQETLARALVQSAPLRPDSNILGWLITILRNQFVSEHRKRRREVEDADGRHAGSRVEAPRQESWMEYQEFRRALSRLPLHQRDALILVAASGFSYEEAARISGCPTGTIKSRVNRARSGLATALSRTRLPSISSLLTAKLQTRQARPLPEAA